VKQLFKALLRRMGYAVFRTRGRYWQDGLFTLHGDLFRQDPAFRAAYQRGLKASHGVDPQFEWRVHVALWAATTAMSAPGDFVECGVNAGFISSAIMHRLNWDATGRRFYLIDTFDGPVLTQFSAEEVERGRLKLAEDAIAAGAYVTDLDRVRANFSDWPNAIVVQGAVPDALPALGINEVAFLHIDMNCAFPEKAALDFFWRRLSRGAVVLLDDYAYFGHDEQRKAIDATARTLGAEILSLPTGQGLIVR
jgi:Macrocin-O-methyltransferase (TylF)